MKNFRGPIRGYPGMPQDSSDEEEDDDDVFYVQPVYLPDDFDSDSDEGMDENDLVHFNLVFNGQGEIIDSDGPNDPDAPEDDDDDSNSNGEAEEDNPSDDSDEDYEPDQAFGLDSITTDDDDVLQMDTAAFSSDEDDEVPAGTPPPPATAGSADGGETGDNLNGGWDDSVSNGISEAVIEDIVSEDARMIYKELNGDSGEENESCQITMDIMENNIVGSIESCRVGSPLQQPTESPVDSEHDPLPEEEGHSDDSFEKIPPVNLDGVRSEQHSEAEEVEEEEQYCNPMASADDEEHHEDVLRGDRIGSTTYSERHVLKLLIHWIEKLQKFGKPSATPESSPTRNTGGSFLDSETEESMSLLWDMSAETDVMHFLMSHDVLTLIRDNLDSPYCPIRLKEIALGILANLLSCPSILEDFPEKDDQLHLVERIVEDGLVATEVPLLTQVFAVLRRVVCYLRNAKPLDRWMKLFLHQDFINAANFLLASSTNVILLGDVIVTFFTLMEVLSLSHQSDEGTESEKISKKELVLAESFKPLYTSNFVPSLCEGINELLKDTSISDPASSTFPRQRPTDSAKQTRSGAGTETRPDFYDDLIIPEGHVQNAVLNGFASLSYLQKFEAGKEVLKRHHSQIQQVLVVFLGKFQLYTEMVDQPEILDYFAITMDLLSLCHVEKEKVESIAITTPASTAISLIEKEKKLNETHVVTVAKENSSVEIELQSSQVSPFGIIFYNYLMALDEKFGCDAVKTSMLSTGKEKFVLFYDTVHSIAEKVGGKKSTSETV